MLRLNSGGQSGISNTAKSKTLSISDPAPVAAPLSVPPPPPPHPPSSGLACGPSSSSSSSSSSAGRDDSPSAVSNVIPMRKVHGLSRDGPRAVVSAGAGGLRPRKMPVEHLLAAQAAPESTHMSSLTREEGVKESPSSPRPSLRPAVARKKPLAPNMMVRVVSEGKPSYPALPPLHARKLPLNAATVIAPPTGIAETDVTKAAEGEGSVGVEPPGAIARTLKGGNIPIDPDTSAVPRPDSRTDNKPTGTRRGDIDLLKKKTTQQSQSSLLQFVSDGDEDW